jgi:hypothetical protein
MTGMLRLLEILRREAPRICAAAGRSYEPVLLRDGIVPEPRPSHPIAHGVGVGMDESTGLNDQPDAGPDVDAGGRGSGMRLAQADPAGFIAAWLAGHPDRRRAGLYLTPPATARAILMCVSRNGGAPRTVCDPAVGAGVFLTEALRIFGPQTEVWGIDIDPMAVALARLSVWLSMPPAPVARSASIALDVCRRIRHADALLSGDPFKGAAPRTGFDLVCGNPPFGNAIEGRTSRSSEERRLFKALFPDTARGPYDRSILFVDLSAHLLSEAGGYGLLLPRALLAARYAQGLREKLHRCAPLRAILTFESSEPVPECDIAMVAWIGSRIQARAEGGGRPTVSGRMTLSGEVRIYPADSEHPARTVSASDLSGDSWGALMETADLAAIRLASRHPVFGDYFHVCASATVSEAYRLSGLIREATMGDEPPGEETESEARTDFDAGWRFVTVRLITRHRSGWGLTPARFLNNVYQRPVLPRSASVPVARAALYSRPKIIVAGLSRNVKAMLDQKGIYAGSVGTLSAIPLEGDPALVRRILRRSTLLLNGEWVSAVHRARRGPLALGGGSIPFGKRDLAALPFPAALAEEGATPDADLLARLLASEDRELPRDPRLVLGILDAAADTLLVSEEPVRRIDPASIGRWDRLTERAMAVIAG